MLSGSSRRFHPSFSPVSELVAERFSVRVAGKSLKLLKILTVDGGDDLASSVLLEVVFEREICGLEPVMKLQPSANCNGGANAESLKEIGARLAR